MPLSFSYYFRTFNLLLTACYTVLWTIYLVSSCFKTCRMQIDVYKNIRCISQDLLIVCCGCVAVQRTSHWLCC